MDNNYKIAFVNNVCSHYTVGTFEILAKRFDVDYYFFSDEREWYWQPQHGVRQGNFRHKYLKGFRLGNTRITPTLPVFLWHGKYDLYIKCINGRFALPLTFLIAKLRRKPFILWTGIWMRLQTPVHRFIFPLTQYIYRHSDAIVVYGEHVKEYLVTEDVQPDRIFVAQHSVDNKLYNRQVEQAEKDSLRQQLRIGPDKKIILYLGRLEEVKGLWYLIDGFASLRRNDLVLVLAGDGSLRTQLEDRVKKIGLEDSVRFAGYVPIANAIVYYANAWAYVLPSITLPTGNELWGLVVNEAFNQGVPVIATQAVGAAAGRMIEHGVNGLVIPERDSSALAQALLTILENPDLHDCMSKNARKRIESWTQNNMVKGFETAIDYVTRTRRT
jgi:glycosyltransferase involved in cell wall biosynthesis